MKRRWSGWRGYELTLVVFADFTTRTSAPMKMASGGKARPGPLLRSGTSSFQRTQSSSSQSSPSRTTRVTSSLTSGDSVAMIARQAVVVAVAYCSCSDIRGVSRRFVLGQWKTARPLAKNHGMDSSANTDHRLAVCLLIPKPLPLLGAGASGRLGTPP